MPRAFKTPNNIGNHRLYLVETNPNAYRNIDKVAYIYCEALKVANLQTTRSLFE